VLSALPGFPAGRLCHATCAAGSSSGAAVPDDAVAILHALAGGGSLWLGDDAVELIAGRSVVLPSGVSFRYRAGADRLTLLLATMPGRGSGTSVADRPAEPVVVAPDGSGVRPLARAPGERGSLAEFELAPGATSKPVRHYELEEIWFFVAGSGEMWREGGGPVPVETGDALTIPARIAFQFRNRGDVPLRIVGLTLPAWPLDRPQSEVVDTGVSGPWAACVG
jgi:mannose-6-phosphate isomerase-like protein (cupin superfamily)